MASLPGIPIARHAVSHVQRLTVDPSILSARYARDCSSRNCDAACCTRGVWVDVDQQAAILASAALIQLYMTSEQEHAPARWFGGDIKHDADFPSGRAIGTEVHGDACVFLNSERRCVLHAVDEAEKPAARLKPFYCRIYPLVLDEGVLTLDEPAGGERPACCTQTAGGERTIFETCAGELADVLGVEGVRELHEALAAR